MEVQPGIHQLKLANPRPEGSVLHFQLPEPIATRGGGLMDMMLACTAKRSAPPLHIYFVELAKHGREVNIASPVSVTEGFI